jgi:hypothetical protein
MTSGWIGDEPDIVVDGRGVARDAAGARRKSYGPPPDKGPPPHVLDVPAVTGRRLILMTENGPIYDCRAASEVFADESGTWIKVVEEWRWYAWREMPEPTRPPSCPRARAWSTTNIWVEP